MAKIRANDLDEKDLQYLKSFVKPEDYEYLRLTLVTTRAITVCEEAKQLPAGDVEPETPSAATNPDWINKFQDDAGLIDDRQAREWYARILAGEVTQPGSMSLSTLKVLRYLDQDVAESFGRLQQVVLDRSVVPFAGRKEVYDGTNVAWNDLLRLEEVGLLNTTETQWSAEGELVVRLTAHRRLARLQHSRSSVTASVDLQVFPLTQAGRELTRVADTTPVSAAYEPLIRWLRAGAPLRRYRVWVAPMAAGYKDDDEVDAATKWEEIAFPEDEGATESKDT